MDNYSNIIPENLKFPKTIDFKVWAHYLERNLTFNERILLENFRSEKYINESMNQLYKQCINKGNICVPVLTDLDGNCLFQSLIYHGIGKNIENIRIILSLIMYIYKDYKTFLPGNDNTLYDIFNLTNEVKFVSSSKKINNITNIEFYKYEYNTMCQDLSNKSSWCRLPTQLILMVISYIFKVDIKIINNINGYEHNINAFETVENKPELKTIYLGHLGESHYVPIILLNDQEEINPIYYNDAKKKLLIWAKRMEQIKINKYNNQLETNDKDMATENNNFNDIDLAKIRENKKIKNPFTVSF